MRATIFLAPGAPAGNDEVFVATSPSAVAACNFRWSLWSSSKWSLKDEYKLLSELGGANGAAAGAGGGAPATAAPYYGELFDAGYEHAHAHYAAHSDHDPWIELHDRLTGRARAPTLARAGSGPPQLPISGLLRLFVEFLVARAIAIF
ncbi:hypothetical protein EVAR_41534_1 [Eumeta japonica]|uniref:Uncharacterized protein n=1 Tax=Eumeta variegata TaxID=151549 RepID=A0A4C1X695_EUMVA|nr:hypothetical protein EVAR_41534_1 [Eumeta japonica]